MKVASWSGCSSVRKRKTPLAIFDRTIFNAGLILGGYLQSTVRFHQVGAPREGFWCYLTENDSLFLWTFLARISKVLRVRSPEARRWNGHSLHFPTPCIELQNVEIKLVCAYQTFRLLLGQVKIIKIEK